MSRRQDYKGSCCVWGRSSGVTFDLKARRPIAYMTKPGPLSDYVEALKECKAGRGK